MKQIGQWVLAFAEAIGGPGLFLIAFLDSSFLSFPQANDLLIVLKVAQHKELMPYYAGLATLGSLAGCLALYAVARKSGEAIIRKRARSERIEKVRVAFERYGLLAILVPSILPPPAPFKLFVLMAGVGAYPVSKFVFALLLGRGFRYFGIGLLTIRYGDAAMALLEEHGRTVSYVVAGLVVAGAVAYALVRRRRTARV